jgi:chondroitin-sulfate-ABC endolyase/exolyase
MLCVDQAKATLSVCDPDLHLYSGKEADQYDANGRQREVSVYSRKWFRAASAPSQVRVTLAGTYRLSRPDARVTATPADANRTVLTFTCRDGLPVEAELTAEPQP